VKVDASDGQAADLSHSPTVTIGGTREGTILGCRRALTSRLIDHLCRAWLIPFLPAFGDQASA
jgi:hypothetical protein